MGTVSIWRSRLLKEDFHTLFDKGYLTVTPEYRVEVSKRIRDDWGNGRDYYAFHGKKLVVTPGKVDLKPAREFLEWHNENVFVS